jgi:hypothetical protein
VGSFEQQGVCKHFLDQVDPTIRWVAGGWLGKWLAGVGIHRANCRRMGRWRLVSISRVGCR